MRQVSWTRDLEKARRAGIVRSTIVQRKLYRRVFNKLAVLTGASVLTLPTGAFAARTPARSVELTDDERALIERFAEVYLPTEGSALKPRSEVPVVDNVAHALSLLDDTILEQVRVGLKLFDYGSVLIGFHFARFVNLGEQDCLDYTERWEHGIEMQRGIVGVLKKLICFGYWKDIDAGRAIGYAGPVSVAGGVPSLGNAPMPTEATDG
jgi:hypothetical protein